MTSDHVVQIAGVIPEATVAQFFESLRSNSFVTLEQNVNNLLLEGYSARQLIEQMFERLISDAKVTDVQKANILLKISEADKNLTDGCDEYLQLLHVASVMMKTFCFG